MDLLENESEPSYFFDSSDTDSILSDYELNNNSNIKIRRRTSLSRHISSKTYEYVESINKSIVDVNIQHKIKEELSDLALFENQKFERKPELNTPDFSNKRKLNHPQSLIKTCLFKQSPAFRSQILTCTPRLLIYEGNSTCATIDVQDLSIDEFKNKPNIDPFIVKSTLPISDISGKSDASLLKVIQKSNNPASKNRVRKFFDEFLNFLNILKCKRSKSRALFKNKTYPDYEIPQVVIECCDATELDNDSGNQSNLPSSRIKNKNYHQSKTNLNHIHLSPNQELRLEELVQCADELTFKVNEFKFFAQELLTDNG